MVKLSKLFDILMAGVISAIVTFTTIKLGIGGTVLGAALGSMLYQFLSHYIKEPLKEPVKNIRTKKIESSVVYTIPLFLVLSIEIIYVLHPFYWKSEKIFYFLEGITNWNLFRSIGIGLLAMGLYLLFFPSDIKQKHGYLLILVSLIMLTRGFCDVGGSISDVIKTFLELSYPYLSFIIIFLLLYLIIHILKESVEIKIDEGEKNEEKKN